MRRRLAFIGMMRANVILLIIMNSFLPGTFAQVEGIFYWLSSRCCELKPLSQLLLIPRSETISLLGLAFRMPHVGQFSTYVYTSQRSLFIKLVLNGIVHEYMINVYFEF